MKYLKSTLSERSGLSHSLVTSQLTPARLKSVRVRAVPSRPASQ